MSASQLIPTFSAAELDAGFQALSPLLERLAPRTVLQPYPAHRIVAALQSLAAPLADTRADGNRLNLWSIAGLKRDEVRNAQALAGLWMTEFGGAVSRRFLATFLQAAIEGVHWSAELQTGYRVSTEISPLGNRADRIDLVVETARHTVGIEIKIAAGLGTRQLQRYTTVIETRARWRHAEAHVVLLAPFKSEMPEVSSVQWSAVSDAADAASQNHPSQRTLVEQLIASFGEHVRTF